MRHSQIGTSRTNLVEVLPTKQTSRSHSPRSPVRSTERGHSRSPVRSTERGHSRSPARSTERVHSRSPARSTERVNTIINLVEEKEVSASRYSDLYAKTIGPLVPKNRSSDPNLCPDMEGEREQHNR